MTRSQRVRPFVPQPAARLFLVATLAAFPMLVVAQVRDPRVATDQSPGRDPLGYAVAADRDWSDQVPAHLATVDGVVNLERDGRVERAEENVPLLAGDRLRTDRGRVEILFADNSTLDLDEFSTVDLLDDALVRLQNGRVRLSIVRTTEVLDYRVDAAGTTTFIRGSGDYRIAVGDTRAQAPEVRVAVLRGSAELASPLGRTVVRAGMEAATTADTAPSQPYVVSVASRDAFDLWSEDQHALHVGSTSVQYLPAELRYESGTFDRYGSWEYTQPYGYVWYPVVSSSWYPYYDGRWSYSAPYGWFWVGAGRWAWPTHHYGRWGYASSRWYWIPERHWAPAWVSWAYAPGYVSWCPLGYNNLPVYPLTGIGAYRGWTVLPSRVWGPNVAVRSYALAGRVPIPNGGGFAVQRNGPARPVNVVRTDERPLGAPSAPRYAVPRSQITTIPGAAASGAAAPRQGSNAPSRTNERVTRPSQDAPAISRDPGSDTIRRAPPRNAMPSVASPAAPESQYGSQAPQTMAPRYSTPRSRTYDPRLTRPSAADPVRPPDDGGRTRLTQPRTMPAEPMPSAGPPAGAVGGAVERRNPYAGRVQPSAAPPPQQRSAPAESGSRTRSGGAQPRAPQAGAPARGAGSRSGAQPSGGRGGR